MSSRCRICLFKVEAENSKSIFTIAKNGQLISEILATFAAVQIGSTDGLPSTLCHKCEEKLNMLIDFRIEIITSDSILRGNCNTIDYSENENLSSSIDIKDEMIDTDYVTTVTNYGNEDQKHISSTEYDNTNTHNADLIDNNDPLALTYICEVCPKKFSSQFLLMKHQEFHDKDLPFKCFECEKSYSRQPHLLQHNKVYHNETYKCTVCEEMFDAYTTFKQHWNDHVEAFGVKPCRRSSRKRKRNKRSLVIRSCFLKKKFRAAQAVQTNVITLS